LQHPAQRETQERKKQFPMAVDLAQDNALRPGLSRRIKRHARQAGDALDLCEGRLRFPHISRVEHVGEEEEVAMTLLVIIVVLVLLFGGGGYYGYNRYGGAGLGGVLGTLLIILLILWLLGALGGVHI
jgi:hypothetical protein